MKLTGPIVDSIRGFAHAGGFATARRCLRFVAFFESFVSETPSSSELSHSTIVDIVLMSLSILRNSALSDVMLVDKIPNLMPLSTVRNSTNAILSF